MAAATHPERHLALRAALDGWGYTGAISEGFPIWSPSKRRSLLYADYVAFTNIEQRDMSTSAIVAHVVDADTDVRRRLLPAAAALGAPAVLAALPDHLTLWQTATDVADATELASVPVTTPSELVGRTSALSQDAVAKAKTQGFHPALFPLGLDVLNNSRNRARTYLTEQVEQALVRLTAINARHDITARLVIGALAVLMIRDKTDPLILADSSPGVLVDVALQRYPGYFGWMNDLSERQRSSFTSLIRDLGRDINFAALEPSMVSDVYEQALVTKLIRRQRGSFYTPPGLANQMMNVLPFESIEPSQRSVLDPACGSGTMLLAAANRLNRLQPSSANAMSWHRYLISHLRGYDDDALATEITKLCLLMSAMPIGNSWQVDTLDTLSINLRPEQRPKIIVSNPPWQFNREGENTAERAHVFLSWMLQNLAEGGFLASVVPLSWINKKASRSSREALLENAELLEVWRLPSEVFSSTASTIAPAVIVAQKHGPTGYQRHFTLMKTVRTSSVQSFLSTGCADEAYLSEPTETGDRLTYGPLTRELDKRPDLATISDAANVYTGRPQRRGRPDRSLTDATHLELGSLRGLKAFRNADADFLRPVRYPEDYGHARPTDERVRAHKVIVAGKHFSTNNPWRLQVGYDTYGVSLRESFFSIVPKAKSEILSRFTEWQQLCIIMAVLGSGLASSWMDENEPTRNISIGYLKRFPLPTEASSLLTLAQAGGALVNAVNGADIDEIRDCSVELEHKVNDVYELSPEARSLIAVRLAGEPAFEGIARYPALPSREVTGDDIDIPSFGHVLEVDEAGLLMWISGVTPLSGVRLIPPLKIPGSLCREGADFTVAGDLEDLAIARFGFHRADWLSEDDLTNPNDTHALAETVDE